MNSKKMDTGSKDLISSLPDALICHILSFLYTKDVALTSVLSKRWRFLLAFVPNLEFGRPTRIHVRRRFKVFVNRVMALQGNAPLNKLSLRCKLYSDSPPIDGWILNALKRGLAELDLDITSRYDYPLPPMVLMSKTLVVLKITGSEEFTIDVGEFFLPKLKTLDICDVSFVDESGAAFAKLISGCPALEELVMVKGTWDHYESCSISNPTLKRVTIYCEDIDDNPKSVSFDTPNLVYLEFTDNVAVNYPKVNFDSLVEASLGLRIKPDRLYDARIAVKNCWNYSVIGNATDFLMGISNVKTLYLSSDTIEVLVFCCTAIPVFNNLLHLTIETSEETEWDALPNLLEHCPNLETLVFEGLHYRDTKQCFDAGYSFNETKECFGKDADRCVCKPWDGTPNCISSSPVKTLKVLKYGEITYYTNDMDRQSDLIKYFVETMPNLEEVILYWDTPFDGDLNIESTEFQELEKVASTKCKIQIISNNISLSSTVYSSSSSSLSAPVFFKNTFPV